MVYFIAHILLYLVLLLFDVGGLFFKYIFLSDSGAIAGAGSLYHLFSASEMILDYIDKIDQHQTTTNNKL